MPSPAPRPPLARPFRRAAVLGAGVMGSQIAALLAGAGLEVELLDLSGPPGDQSAPATKSLAAAARLSPDPFSASTDAARIRPGSLDTHLDRITSCDWIIEVVVERLDVKRSLLARVERCAAPHAVVSTNTSGLPVASLAEGLGPDLRRRFLGTHFFNPPRYLRLLELIPTRHTDGAVLERVARFARLHLGKAVVVAKDSPCFIANRIGTFAALAPMRLVADGEFSVEEVDALTGPLVGRPRSATFRTADLVGLDVIEHVARHLHEALAQDPGRDLLAPPWLLSKLVERGSLGQKSGRGFYAKVGGEVLAVDPKTMEYRKRRALKLGDLDALAAVEPLGERLRRLHGLRGRAGDFFRRTTHQLLAYAARCLPEIADDVADVDRAMEAGFGWALGPFALWDALGVASVLADLRATGERLPRWIDDLEASGAAAFHARRDDGVASWSVPSATHVPRPRPADEIRLAGLAADAARVVDQAEDWALLDLGEGVALFEFRSKLNTLGRSVMDGLRRALDRVEAGPWHGLVIGNDAEHFSVGANLLEVATAALHGRWAELDAAVAAFQDLGRRVRDHAKPVVVATQGRVLGGACELALWCPRPVCALESYVGLVEVGVGLVPAGGGTTRMTAMAAARAASAAPEHIAPHLRAAFETVAKAVVAGSARRAVELGTLPAATTIVANPERRLWVAREQVLHLATAGWLPPPSACAIPVLGRGGRLPFEVGLQHLVEGGHVDEWLAHVAGRIAWIMTGGDLSAPALVHEQRLLDLEREVFLSLLGERRTQQKIADVLTRKQGKTTQVLAKGLVNLASVFQRKPGRAKGDAT